MNGVYSTQKEEWALYKDKVFEEPHRLENLSLSLKNSQYKEQLSPEMKTFFEDLYNTIHKVNMESYSKQALQYITIIRHKVESNEAKLLMLGCKCCNKITDALNFASDEQSYREDALNAMQSFFTPYCSEVQSADGTMLERKIHWKHYWETQCQIPDSMQHNFSTGSSAASSSQPSQTASDVTSSSQGDGFMDWEPGPSSSKYDCIVNKCRMSRSVLEPHWDQGSTHSISSDEEDQNFGS